MPRWNFKTRGGRVHRTSVERKDPNPPDGVEAPACACGQEIVEPFGCGLTWLTPVDFFDQIIKEPDEGAHTDHDAAARYLDSALTRQLAEAVSLSQEERLARRYAKLRQFGRWSAADKSN